jgi:hypothetical protein
MFDRQKSWKEVEEAHYEQQGRRMSKEHSLCAAVKERQQDAFGPWDASGRN